MQIVIYNGADFQKRNLKPSVSVDRAKELLKNLYEEDYLGCDTFVLYDDNNKEIMCIEREN